MTVKLRRCMAQQRWMSFGRYSVLKDTWPVPQFNYKLPQDIIRPPYIADKNFDFSQIPAAIVLKEKEDIEEMKQVGQLTARLLDLCQSFVKPGVTTKQIDALVFEEAIRQNAYPSPLGYMGYPAAICTSVNNVLVHGIPNDRPLEDGDLVNVDITVYKNGFHGDASRTFLVGDVDEKGRQLVECTKNALMAAIEICKPGVPLHRIGQVIEKIATRAGFTINRDFAGHGIGLHFHEPPLIFHHAHDSELILQEGMTFTIEPILCQGQPHVKAWRDGWTMASVDGKP